MKKLKDEGFDNNTIVAFTTDNGAENFTWPDGGQTPFAGGKGTALEGGFRVPCMIRWPGRVPAGKVENGIVSGLDWFPTFVAAAGNPTIAEELRKGKQLGDKTYKVYLDGYNQMDLITGKGPSARHSIFYFTEGTLSAVRLDDFKYRFTDQPGGGWAARSRLIGRSSPISALIPSNARTCPTAIRDRWHSITGLLTSSGDSSSCSRRWVSSPKLRSSFHRCRRVRASIWKPSRSRSRRPCSRMLASRICGDGHRVATGRRPKLALSLLAQS